MRYSRGWGGELVIVLYFYRTIYNTSNSIGLILGKEANS